MVDIAVFDLYYLLVEVIFGSILLAGFAMVVVFIIMGTLMKMSPLLQFFIIGLFLLTFGVGYGGAIIAVPAMIIGFIYFASGIIRLVVGKILI